MKRGLYLRLAWDGLRKNRQLSWPYLLTCVGMVAMHYILAFLASPTALEKLPQGRQTIETMMALGCLVVLLFSLIFLFYTYSFLNRRRAREFGLYNVLGMGKRNLSRIVLWESAITATLAMIGGLALGAALSKLAELGLVNLMNGEIDYRVRLDFKAVFRTVVCYVPVFALNALVAVIRTRCSSAVNLLKAESAGEKPPRGNWLLAILGIVILGVAYWMALSIKNPLDALMWFFVAVLLVIVATYMLLIAGSVWLCRRLQANKRYYYRADHFVSVSSMTYRMKRNGAGLASICVIATMVLVMLSTTTCLMAGIEDTILAHAPREINLQAWLNDVSEISDENLGRIRATTERFAAENGVTMENSRDFGYVYLAGTLKGDTIQCNYTTALDAANLGSLRELYIVSMEDYTSLTGRSLNLGSEEALLLVNRCEFTSDTLILAMGEEKNTFHIVSVEKGVLDKGLSGTTAPGMTVVVANLKSVVAGFPVENEYGKQLFTSGWKYGFDTGLDDQENADFERELSRYLEAEFPTEDSRGWRSIMVSSRANNATDFRASYGGLFFIGIVLSIVFLLAAVLIIYYKQVSEGYEDVKRFEIMQKVGMTKPEIKRSIGSQLLMVFMLPLAFAGLHLTFAFPMIRKMLLLFGLTNIGLFVTTTLISFAVFAAFYWIVYRMTSGVYYRIVSKTSIEDAA